MKKSKKIIAAAVFAVMLISILPVSVLAKDIANKNSVSYEEKETGSVQQISDSSLFAEKINSNKILQALSLNSDNMKSFVNAEEDYNLQDSIYDNIYVVYEAVFNDGSVVSFDKDMNVVAYSNFEGNSYNKISNEALIDILKQEYGIDKTYTLVKSYSDNNDILYYWSKTDENGIDNAYDALSVRAACDSGKIVLFNRFKSVNERSEIIISEEEAKNTALNIKEEFNEVTSIKMDYVKPNGFWRKGEYTGNAANEVKLVYNIEINNRYYVYVDVETGEIIGGDMPKCISE